MHASQISALEREVAKFRPINKRVTPAPHKVTIQPHEWVYDYPERPHEAVELGLRVPSLADSERAEEIGREVLRNGGGEEERLHALRSYAVARCICSLADFTKAHTLFQMAEDQVPVALNPRTVERILEEVADLMVRTIPLHPEADGEEVAQLITLLSMEDTFASVPPARASTARKYLHRALLELTGE